MSPNIYPKKNKILNSCKDFYMNIEHTNIRTHTHTTYLRFPFYESQKQQNHCTEIVRRCDLGRKETDKERT